MTGRLIPISIRKMSCSKVKPVKCPQDFVLRAFLFFYSI